MNPWRPSSIYHSQMLRHEHILDNCTHERRAELLWRALLYKMTCIEVIKQTQYNLLMDVLRKEQKRLFLKRKET